MIWFVFAEKAAADFEAVAFTAWANEAIYEEGDTVIFDGVVSNIGNHYNPSTSIFTCPINGVYAFFSSITSQEGYFMFADIMHNSDDLTTVAADDDGLIQGSNFAVILCNQGDTVFIQAEFADDHRMYGDSQRKYSTFSGFLLYPV